MVDCTEFLDGYSDFRDGLLAADREQEFEGHMQACESCARYDRVVHGGVQVYRSLPQITPSEDFQSRLLGRLYALESPERHRSGAPLGVTLAICLALGAGAWAPMLWTGSEDPVRLPPIVAHAPYHDLSPVLMRHTPPPLRTEVFQARPAFYEQGPWFEPARPHTTLTSLAYRPANSLAPQR